MEVSNYHDRSYNYKYFVLYILYKNVKDL